MQNTKLMNIPHFGIKIDLKLLKTWQKNGLKIDEFYTHHSTIFVSFLPLSIFPSFDGCISSHNYVLVNFLRV